MKLTEKQVIEIAKKVLKDIGFLYYSDRELKAGYTEDKDLLEEGVVRGWMFSCDWFDPDFLDGMDKTAILIINDDTGEPVVLSLATGGGGNCLIAKNDKGRYYVEKNY